MDGDLQIPSLEQKLAAQLRKSGRKNAGRSEYQRLLKHLSKPENQIVEPDLKVATLVVALLTKLLGKSSQKFKDDSEFKPRTLISLIDALGKQVIRYAESLTPPGKFAPKVNEPNAHLKLGAHLLAEACRLVPPPVAIKSLNSATKKGARKKETTLAYFVVANPEVLELKPEILSFNSKYISQDLSWSIADDDSRWSAARAAHRATPYQFDELLNESKDQTPPPAVVLQAVNRLQETEWQINQSILGWIKSIDEENRRHFFPNYPSPQEPRFQTERQTLDYLIKVAACRGDYSFNLAYRLDYRGRIYVNGSLSGINPQGADFEKALLRFSKSVPLGKDGWKWLCVNLFNFTKLPTKGATFEDRKAWVEQHRQAIEEFAADPTGRGAAFWEKNAHKKKRWRFLAACLEVSRVWQHVDQGHSLESFESSLPVSIDGVCNGYQHMSAILRDPETGKSTNVLPSQSQPNDFYADVAEKLGVTFELQLTEHEIDKLVDQIISTLSMQLRAFRDNIEKLTKAVAEMESAVCWPTEDGWLLRAYRERQQVSEVNFSEFLDVNCEKTLVASESSHSVPCPRMPDTREVVKKVLMPYGYGSEKWRLIQVVKDLLKGKQLPLSPPQRDARKRTTRMPQRIRLNYLSKAPLRDKVAKSRIGKSLLANFIHSLDATLLHRVVNAAYPRGLNDILVVHDCFGTQAGRMEELHQTLLAEFGELYGNSPLVSFIQFYRNRLDWLNAYRLQRKKSHKVTGQKLEQIKVLLDQLEECIGNESNWFQVGESQLCPYLFS